MKPTSPATASAISSTLSYSHHSASIIRPSWRAALRTAPANGERPRSTARVPLDVAVPGGDWLPPLVGRRPEQSALHDQAAGPLVGERIAVRTHHVALAGAAVRLDPQPKEDRPAARPSALDLRRIVATDDAADDDRPRRLPAAAAARPGAGARSSACASAAGARPGPPHGRGALSRSGALARRFGDRDRRRDGK